MIGRRPFTLVIAAPSGAGKTSLARALVERRADVVFSLSATTRPPRPHEQDGRDYRFVDEAGFDALVAQGELLEWAVVHGRRYGTLRSGVEASLEQGHVVMLDIDVQGARLLRASLPDAVLVFILPPSVSEMTRRLVGRGSGEQADELTRRMLTAQDELDEVAGFDYVVVNDSFDATLAELDAIVTAERCRTTRTTGLADALAGLRRDIDELIRGS